MVDRLTLVDCLNKLIHSSYFVFYLFSTNYFVLPRSTSSILSWFTTITTVSVVWVSFYRLLSPSQVTDISSWERHLWTSWSMTRLPTLPPCPSFQVSPLCWPTFAHSLSDCWKTTDKIPPTSLSVLQRIISLSTSTEPTQSQLSLLLDVDFGLRPVE